MVWQRNVYDEPEGRGNRSLAERCVELEESRNNLVAERGVELGEPGGWLMGVGVVEPGEKFLRSVLISVCRM